MGLGVGLGLGLEADAHRRRRPAHTRLRMPERDGRQQVVQGGERRQHRHRNVRVEEALQQVQRPVRRHCRAQVDAQWLAWLGLGLGLRLNRD